MFQTCETHNYSPTLGELCTAGYPIFNDWWDTFVPEHKAELIDKIKKAYWFNQIGAETPDRFMFYINAHLQRVMPYYNKLYESELIKVNPMLNHSMKINGRTIENLVKKANSSNDQFAKAIRDFAGVSDKSDSTVGHSTSETIGTRSDDENTGYSKQGTDDKTEDTITHETENQTTKRNQDEITDSENLGKENTVVHGTTLTEGTVTDNIDEHTKQTTTYGQNQTENVVGGEGTTFKGDGSKDWTETLDDDSTTKTTTHLKEHTGTSGERDYADTPQKQLNVTDQNGTALVRRDYLTNVTWEEGSTDHTADTTQDVAFADDQTKVHNETTHDESETNTQRKTETTKQAGGSDVTDTDKSGDNTKTTDMTETTDSNTDKNSTDTLNKTISTTENINRDTTTDGESVTTTDDDWTEKGTGTGSLLSNTKTNTTTDSKSDTTGSDETREHSDTTSSATKTTQESSDSTRDEGTTNITEGFMNVSSSALLNAFRETFINVDNMIIEELRNDFMLVY